MLKGQIFIWASSQNFSCDEAKMKSVQEPEILIVFRTIVLNKIIWSIYCIKTPGSISAKILCLKRQHVFKVQNNGEFFKNILVVKMRTQSCPFAGRGRNSAVFMKNQPQLNSRNPEALTVLWVHKMAAWVHLLPLAHSQDFRWKVLRTRWNSVVFPMYKLAFFWNTAMEGDGPLCRKETELQLNL